MKPSIALQEKRDAIRDATARYRASNPRVFGSVLHGADEDVGDLDILVDAPWSNFVRSCLLAGRTRRDARHPRRSTNPCRFAGEVSESSIGRSETHIIDYRLPLDREENLRPVTYTYQMLLFLDTEFTGLDQIKPDLITIGLVDEVGREFYAELPESHWTVQCNEWVHFNVLPHLWGGDYVQSETLIRERLTSWIESIPEEAVIVSDWPNGDFFIQLKRLLPQWPKNLSTWPMQFGAWSMEEEQQPVLRKLMDDYHTPQRPRYHALHDAHSLRLALMYAVEHGWRPSFGGEAAKAAVERAAQSINETLRMTHGLKGLLKKPDAPITIEAMNQAIIDRAKDGYG